MAEDSFSKFKKRYREGKISTTQMPPLPAGPSSVGRMVGGAIATIGRQKLMDTLNKSRVANAAARAGKGGKGRSGTLSEKLEGTRARPRTEKESNKFGPLVKRQENMPAKQSRSIVKREENMPSVVREGKKDLQKYNPGGRSVSAQGRTFGDKGQAGRVVGLSNRGKLAAGALGAGAIAVGAAAYKKADTAKSDEKKKPSTFAKTGPVAAARDMYKGAPKQIAAVKAEIDARKKSATSSPGASVGGTKNGPFKSDFAKKSLQGRKAGGSSAAKAPAKAGDKSRMANKPMSNFERMKARQYEKEGYGGRSMTAEKAKAQVRKERGYKFKDLFK